MWKSVLSYSIGITMTDLYAEGVQGLRPHLHSWANYFKIMQFFTRNWVYAPNFGLRTFTRNWVYAPNFGLRTGNFLRFAHTRPSPLKRLRSGLNEAENMLKFIVAVDETWVRSFEPEMCVCVFGLNVAFNYFSVISRRCLVATGSSMLTFIVLPHWSIMSQTLDMIPHPVTLSWH